MGPQALGVLDRPGLYHRPLSAARPHRLSRAPGRIAGARTRATDAAHLGRDPRLSARRAVRQLGRTCPRFRQRRDARPEGPQALSARPALPGAVLPAQVDACEAVIIASDFL